MRIRTPGDNPSAHQVEELMTIANVSTTRPTQRKEWSDRSRIPGSSPYPRPWTTVPSVDKSFLMHRPAAKGVLAIASSTGGPDVLTAILSRLPADFPYAVVIAQHIAPGFAGGLAQWLGRYTHLPVILADGNEPLVAGVVYVSPTERNLTVTSRRRTALVESSAEDVYHPSCDALLTSAAKAFGQACIGVILTGMGRDGATGIEIIRKHGGVTIAQDEASSVVFGMNGAAVKAGDVKHVLAPTRIPDAVMRIVGASLPV